jgi:hypothetical protein
MYQVHPFSTFLILQGFSMSRRLLIPLWTLLIFTVATAPAQDDRPVPGTFRSFIVADPRTDLKDPRNRTNMMHDLVTESGLNPTVAVFARSTPATDDAPVASLVRQLDSLAQKYRADRFGAFVIFLTLGDEYPKDTQRDERAKEVRDLAEQLKVPNVPFGLAAADSEAVKAWGLQAGDDITVVLFDRLKVVRRWTFSAEKPPSEDDIKAIAATVENQLRPQKK